MTAGLAAPTQPLVDSDEHALAELERFLLYLGSGLTAAGEAVNEIQEGLRRVAAAYGARDAVITVLPTFLVLTLDPRRPTTLETTKQLRGVLRLAA